MKADVKKKSMFLMLDQRELSALNQVTHEGLALYLVIKSKANFKTGFVGPFGGSMITLCELGSLIERRIKGVKRKGYSSQDVHRILDRLTKVGLISRLSICKQNGVTMWLGSGDADDHGNVVLGCDTNQANLSSACSKGVGTSPPKNAQLAGSSGAHEFSGSSEAHTPCESSAERLCAEAPENRVGSGSRVRFSSVNSSQKSEIQSTPPQPPASRGELRKLNNSPPKDTIEKLESKKFLSHGERRQLAELRERRVTGGVVL